MCAHTHIHTHKQNLKIYMYVYVRMLNYPVIALLRIIYFLYMCICLLVYMCSTCMRVPEEVRGGFNSLGSWVTDGCELSDTLETKLGPSQEQQVLLILSETSIQWFSGFLSDQEVSTFINTAYLFLCLSQPHLPTALPAWGVLVFNDLAVDSLCAFLSMPFFHLNSIHCW